MSLLVQTASQMAASRAGARRELSYFWILAVVLAAVIGCAVLASTYPDPVGLDAATIVGP